MNITTQQRIDFDKQTQSFIDNLHAMNKKDGELTKRIASAKLNSNQFLQVELTLELLENTFQEICCQMSIARLSQTILKVKSDQYLNLARKKCHTYLQLWETVVGRMLDTPLTEKTLLYEHISNVMTNIERFELFKRIGFIINRLEIMHGDTSKWKWTFVDIESRLLTVIKNAIDFKKLIQDMDPVNEFYRENTQIMDKIKELLYSIGEQYRKKYEISNKNIEDMKKALSYVNVYRRFLLLIGGDPNEVTILKKKHDSWKKKLEEDLAKLSAK